MTDNQHRPIVVIDCETTGLNPRVDAVWEIAAIRYEWVPAKGDRLGCWWRMLAPTILVDHHPGLARHLPEPFAADYLARFRPRRALQRHDAAAHLHRLFKGCATLVAANPAFDAAMLEPIIGAPAEPVPWHYRLRDVEALAAGRLGYDPGGLNDCLAALGLGSNDGTHTAAGDVDAADRILRHVWPWLRCGKRVRG